MNKYLIQEAEEIIQGYSSGEIKFELLLNYFSQCSIYVEVADNDFAICCLIRDLKVLAIKEVTNIDFINNIINYYLETGEHVMNEAMVVQNAVKVLG